MYTLLNLLCEKKKQQQRRQFSIFHGFSRFENSFGASKRKIYQIRCSVIRRHCGNKQKIHGTFTSSFLFFFTLLVQKKKFIRMKIVLFMEFIASRSLLATKNSPQNKPIYECSSFLN